MPVPHFVAGDIVECHQYPGNHPFVSLIIYAVEMSALTAGRFQSQVPRVTTGDDLLSHCPHCPGRLADRIHTHTKDLLPSTLNNSFTLSVPSMASCAFPFDTTPLISVVARLELY